MATEIGLSAGVVEADAPVATKADTATATGSRNERFFIPNTLIPFFVAYHILRRGQLGALIQVVSYPSGAKPLLIPDIVVGRATVDLPYARGRDYR